MTSHPGTMWVVGYGEGYMEVDFLGSLRSEVDVRIATVPICTVCDL